VSTGDRGEAGGFRELTEGEAEVVHGSESESESESEGESGSESAGDGESWVEVEVKVKVKVKGTWQGSWVNGSDGV